MMEAWQYTIRKKMAEEDKHNLFGAWWEKIDTDIKKSVVREVDYATSEAIILKYEWLGCMAAGFNYSYGIFWEGVCGGVVVYGEPTTKTLAESIAGQKWKDKVIQIQRGACVHWCHPHSASKLIAESLKQTQKRGFNIVVAFSDPMAGEIGTVYQATNWIYCGLTEKRPDYFDCNGDRITGHVGKIKSWMTKKDRLRKGRYIYILGNHSTRSQILKDLRWKKESYPKRAEEVSREIRPLPGEGQGAVP